MVKVTVIMPSLNVEPYIRQCMSGVCNQVLRELEILCIDAGSTDGTWEILQEYAQKDSRVKVIRSEKKSYGYQVNLGLKMATGKYVAILETDDYVVPEMYGKLFETAEKFELDYVKADYDSILQLDQEAIFQERFLTLRWQPEWYGTTIGPKQLCYLYTRDLNIWKGVYRLSFLQQHHIRLNETPGAAYQDVGFMMQTLARAQRVMYLDASFYRYRMDREGASTWNPNCFSFIYKEVKWILESGILDGVSEMHREACMERFAVAFLCEYDKGLQKQEYNVDNELFVEPYRWFSKVLSPWLENKNGCITREFKHDVAEIKQALANNVQWALKRKEKIEKETKFYGKLQETSFVIVGAGLRGNNFCKDCIRRKIVPLAFADNNAQMWGRKIGNIAVYSLKECTSAYPDAIFVLSMKNGAEEVKKQLHAAGVCDSNVIVLQ